MAVSQGPPGSDDLDRLGARAPIEPVRPLGQGIAGPRAGCGVVTSQDLQKQECAVVSTEKSCSRPGMTALSRRCRAVGGFRFRRDLRRRRRPDVPVGTSWEQPQEKPVDGGRWREAEMVRCGSFSPSSDPPSPAQVSLRSQRSQVRTLLSPHQEPAHRAGSLRSGRKRRRELAERNLAGGARRDRLRHVVGDRRPPGGHLRCQAGVQRVDQPRS